jgi:hypothetical protein
MPINISPEWRQRHSVGLTIVDKSRGNEKLFKLSMVPSIGNAGLPLNRRQLNSRRKPNFCGSAERAFRRGYNLRPGREGPKGSSSRLNETSRGTLSAASVRPSFGSCDHLISFELAVSGAATFDHDAGLQTAKKVGANGILSKLDPLDQILANERPDFRLTR